MNNKTFRRYYLLACIGIIAASVYPLMMGVRVLTDMIRHGSVMIERYPKYVIPYTPISLALILGVLLIPLFQKFFQRFAFLAASIFSVGVFFLFERLMEIKIVVYEYNLENWQMWMCISFAPPRKWKAADILLGEYNPAFKLHFYLISAVIILSVLNCVYGFANMIRTGDQRRKKSLIIQAFSAAAFLGMCIWACFTAFYRTGEINVSALSAVLMAVFFIVYGVTTGAFTGSFMLGKRKAWSVVLPALVSSLTTLLMYIGEMILLSGRLYRFGTGFFFQGLPAIVLAPVDILIILVSGCISAGIFYALDSRAQS